MVKFFPAVISLISAIIFFLMAFDNPIFVILSIGNIISAIILLEYRNNIQQEIDAIIEIFE